MTTFAEYLRSQADREDRVGWAARMWEKAKIGRISSQTTIIRRMEDFAREAAEAGNEELKNHWEVAAFGAREAAEEYRGRVNEDLSHPAPPHEAIVKAGLAPVVPMPFSNLSSQLEAQPGAPDAQPDAPVKPRQPDVPQPPEGGVPIAVVRMSTSPEPPRHGSQPGTPAAQSEAYVRIERTLADVTATMRDNQDLLVAIAEYLVLQGDQEGLRAALSRALSASQPSGGGITHPSLNWAALWATADHAAPGETG